MRNKEYIHTYQTTSHGKHVSCYATNVEDFDKFAQNHTQCLDKTDYTRLQYLGLEMHARKTHFDYSLSSKDQRL